MVHDSYATHSPNMPKLNNELRSAFVTMYENNDVLMDLYVAAVASLPQDVVVPPPPQQGDLNLSDVLLSDYFFA